MDGFRIALEQLTNEGGCSRCAHEKANWDGDEDDECDNNCADHGPSVPDPVPGRVCDPVEGRNRATELLAEGVAASELPHVGGGFDLYYGA